MNSIKLNCIQEIRWEINMTLEELSRKSSVSRSALNRIENEVTIPNQIQMIYISKALGLTVSDVFNLEWRGYII